MGNIEKIIQALGREMGSKMSLGIYRRQWMVNNKMGLNKQVDRNIRVSIATRYRLHYSGIEFQWPQDFSTVSDQPSLQYNGYRISFRGEVAGE
jgi:hypothetical protein